MIGFLSSLFKRKRVVVKRDPGPVTGHCLNCWSENISGFDGKAKCNDCGTEMEFHITMIPDGKRIT